jgi:fucose permease
MASQEVRASADPTEIQLHPIPGQSNDRPPENKTTPSSQTEAIAPLEVTPLVLLKVISAAFCFFNAGVNDGSLGALIPYILRSYNISTAWMAIPYGVGFFGWLQAGIFGGYLRVTLGAGGYLILGAALQLLAQILRFWVPPFGLFSVTFFFVALGQAFQDSQANTFVATIKNAHRWLGLIHGCYAVGSLVGPLIAAAIASNLNGRWAIFYVSGPDQRALAASESHLV